MMLCSVTSFYKITQPSWRPHSRQVARALLVIFRVNQCEQSITRSRRFGGLQTVANDINTNVCPGEHIVCLIVDECHRATGNALIVRAIKALKQASNGAVRVLGLSATPGSTYDKVQEVIDNTLATRVCFYAESDAEVKKYRHEMVREEVYVESSNDAAECTAEARQMLHGLACKLLSKGAINHVNVDQYSVWALQDRKNAFQKSMNGPMTGCDLSQDQTC